MHRSSGILRTASFAAAVIAAVLAAAPRAPAQGDTGFLRGTGRTDVAVSYGSESFKDFWVGSTKTSDPNVGKVTHETANLWLAYGIDNRTDTVWKQADQNDNAITTVYPVIAGNPGGVCEMVGQTPPEGAVTAIQGTVYTHQDGDSSARYYKSTGTGNTGWSPLAVP
jgi:hypothetical protein